MFKGNVIRSPVSTIRYRADRSVHDSRREWHGRQLGRTRFAFFTRSFSYEINVLTNQLQRDGPRGPAVLLISVTLKRRPHLPAHAHGNTMTMTVHNSRRGKPINSILVRAEIAREIFLRSCVRVRLFTPGAKWFDWIIGLYCVSRSANMQFRRLSCPIAFSLFFFKHFLCLTTVWIEAKTHSKVI